MWTCLQTCPVVTSDGQLKADCMFVSDTGKRSGQACAGLKYTIGEVGFRTPPEK